MPDSVYRSIEEIPKEELELLAKGLEDPNLFESVIRGLDDLKNGRSVPYVRRTERKPDYY